MDINLAPKIIGRVRQAQKARQWLKSGGWWGAIFLALALASLSGANLLLNRSNQSLNEQLKNLEKKIQDQSKLESQQVYLGSKLESFGQLLLTHERHQAIAETVFSLIPSGTSLKGFKVEETGVIALSGSLPSWQLLSRFLNNLNQPTQPLLVESAAIRQISFSPSGVDFDVELKLKL